MALWPEVPQPWSLQVIGWGQVFVLMMQAICLPPGRVGVLSLSSVHPTIFPPPGFMTPDRSTVTFLPTPQETLQDQQISLVQAPKKSTAFALCAGVHESLWAPSRSGGPVSHHPPPLSCGAPTIKPHWPSKPDPLKAPPSNARPLDWGAWCGTQSSQLCGRMWCN